VLKLKYSLDFLFLYFEQLKQKKNYYKKITKTKKEKYKYKL
jgi:hypothetical protein